MKAAASLASWALLLVASWGLLHALGSREQTVALTGAILGPEAALGLLYVPLWLAVVAVAPVLLFAAAVEALAAALWRRRRGQDGAYSGRPCTSSRPRSGP